MATHPVLISYSSLDQHLAEKIALALQERNINCWVGYENIRPGESWPAAIADAINDCEIFLLLLTRNSNSSRQVVRELTQADNLNKKLYCFQPDDLKISKDLLYFFSSIHRHEAFKTGFDIALKKMCDEVSLWLSSSRDKSLTQNGQVTPGSNEHRDAPKKNEETFFNSPQRRKILIGSAVVVVISLILFFFRDTLWSAEKKSGTESSSLAAKSSQPDYQKTEDTSVKTSQLQHQNTDDPSIIEKEEIKVTEAIYDSSDLARKKLSDLGVSWSNQSFVNALVDEDKKSIELFLKGGMSVNAEKDGTSAILYALQPGLRDREWKLRLFIKYGFDVNATLSDIKIMRSGAGHLPNYYDTPLTPAGYDASMKSFKGPLCLWLISWVCYNTLQYDDENLIKLIAENGSRFKIEKDYLKFSKSAFGGLPSYDQVSKLIAKYSK